MSILQLAEWMEGTPIAWLVRDTQWGFAIVVAIHLLGLTLSVGMVMWFDLRLLGLALRNIPASVVYRRIFPWMGIGFGLMFASGGMLLATYATAAYGNVFFRIKACALVLAAINAFVYHRFTERGIAHWDETARPPVRARMAGLTSIVVWTVVILAGRLMSYTIF